MVDVSETEATPRDHLHLVLVALGDGVVPGEAPQASDRLGPFLETNGSTLVISSKPLPSSWLSTDTSTAAIQQRRILNADLY